MTIRPMKTEDAARVADLSTQLGRPNTADDIRRRFQEIQNLNSHALLVAVQPNDEICGFVQVNLEAPELISDQRAEIAALVVDEKWRGNGIGAKLVAAAETWARSKSIHLIRLTSNIRRENAHRFYQREGYEILKTWHLFTKTVAQPLLFAALLIFSSALAAESLPHNLVGRWKLEGLECKSGPLSNFGKRQIPNPAAEHFIILSANGEADDRLVEHGNAKDPAKYCETLYREKWSVRGGKILKHNGVLKYRKGVGGYTCYNVAFPKMNSSDRDWPYEVSGDELKITHGDLPLRVQGKKETLHICENGGPFVEVYQRQK